MKPKPLSELNHFTVPLLIITISILLVNCKDYRTFEFTTRSKILIITNFEK
jgi:hypothetical protein